MLRKYFKILIPLFFFCLLFGLAESANADTHYVRKTGSGSACTEIAPCLTIAAGITAMSGGDTLIVGDGTYVNDPIIGVPSGTAGAWTIVRAENVGGVTVDQSTVTADWEPEPISVGEDSHHIQFEGFRLKGSLSRYMNGVVMSYGDYIKFFRIAAYNMRHDSTATVFTIAHGSDHVLVEECWAWGGGRYKFIAYESTNVIFRRCVARHDYNDDGGADGRNQQALFVNYDSTNSLFQNCIAIDSGVVGSGQQIYGAFWDEHNIEALDKTGKITGSIVLNIRTNAAGIKDKVSGTRTIANNVIWDSNGGWTSEPITNGPVPTVLLRNNTFGNLIETYNDGARGWGTGASDSYGANASIQDSIIYDANSYGVAWEMPSDYNLLYANGENYGEGAFAGAHDYSSENSNATNPFWNSSSNATGCLKYLPRTESNSNCSDKSSTGGKLGAQIMYKYGTSGTLYGEIGYDTLTSDPLWPFPNEDLIKSDFASYDGPGPVGERGFATGTSIDGSPQTLTKYIWEYLGNEIPCEVYDTCSGDEVAPGSPTGLSVM